MNIAEYIPVGHENAISRKRLAMITGLSDRQIRQLIERAMPAAKWRSSICRMDPDTFSRI